MKSFEDNIYRDEDYFNLLEDLNNDHDKIFLNAFIADLHEAHQAILALMDEGMRPEDYKISEGLADSFKLGQDAAENYWNMMNKKQLV